MRCLVENCRYNEKLSCRLQEPVINSVSMCASRTWPDYGVISADLANAMQILAQLMLIRECTALMVEELEEKIHGWQRAWNI